MPKVLVLFHSRTGNTAALADAIAEGAASVRFAEVEVRRIDDLPSTAPARASERETSARAALAKKYRVLESVESLASYDALVIGSPSRYGVMSAEVNNVLEQAGALSSHGALADRVGSAFSAGDTPQGGHEGVVQSILAPMMRYGMLIVPPGYGDLAVAREQGTRVAKVAEWVRHAKSHEHGHAHGHKH